ncbi:hypothetical protein, partial [Xanthomonas oryzae]|uniref:hypothetical protein n=1 Tax=Xanthomonas oryzae TaxID=347 RepID=UPI003CF7B710
MARAGLGRAHLLSRLSGRGLLTVTAAADEQTSGQHTPQHQTDDQRVGRQGVGDHGHRSMTFHSNRQNEIHTCPHSANTIAAK